MKKEVAKKWVKALRSGKYKQGQRYLKQFNSKNQPRHCCLGVLCELYDETMKKNHKKTLVSKTCGDLFVKFNNDWSSLPQIVREWAGISSGEGSFICGHNDGNSLAYLNDTGKKFNTIANVIESNVGNL